MKFYQTTVLMILSIMYAAPVLGAKEVSLSEVTKKVPEVIWNLIDEYGGKRMVYEEVGHLKSFLHLCGKMAKSAGLTGTITFSMVNFVPKLFEILPKKPMFLASLPITLIASLIGARCCFEKQKDFNVTTVWPKRVKIWDDSEIIAIKDKKTNEVEYRSLSDMRLLRRRNLVIPGTFPGPNSYLAERGELVYALNPLDRGKIDILCSDDFDDYNQSDKKLRSLQTPSEYLTGLDVSKDQSTIVTLDSNDFLRKFELQKSEDLDTIMHPEMDTD